MGFSIINHPSGGPHFMETPISQPKHVLVTSHSHHIHGDHFPLADLLIVEITELPVKAESARMMQVAQSIKCVVTNICVYINICMYIYIYIHTNVWDIYIYMKCVVSLYIYIYLYILICCTYVYILYMYIYLYMGKS